PKLRQPSRMRDHGDCKQQQKIADSKKKPKQELPLLRSAPQHPAASETGKEIRHSDSHRDLSLFQIQLPQKERKHQKQNCRNHPGAKERSQEIFYRLYPAFTLVHKKPSHTLSYGRVLRFIPLFFVAVQRI